MDAKTETYFHLAILASMKPGDVATRNNNRLMHHILTTYHSFEFAYKQMFPKANEDVAAELGRAEKYLGKLDLEYKMVTVNDAHFPLQLKNHLETTPVIYYRGNLGLLERDCIAVVGTRNPLNPQEMSDSQKVLKNIVDKNYVIVSGLAQGCDTIAHIAGLKNGTVAVLGTSINKSYPKENEQLQETIAKDHLLISQFPIGIDRFLYFQTEQPLNFKKRNQTTVVLANKGVVVLKTADKGGTQNAISESQYFQRPLYSLRTNFSSENTWTDNFKWADYAGGLVRKVK